MDAVKQYEAALLEAEREGTHIHAIILTNPLNPPGRLYDATAPEGCLKLCSKYNIHPIVDEV
jgi:bifunctional pyridoxal-dependent enzyme with beta-cystathionase and maltose regulon repressor activities